MLLLPVLVLKLWMLEFPVSKTDQAREKCICKVMKYWVCFDYELTPTSPTSCDLAEILMRWEFYSHFACLLYLWFSVKKLEIVWKKLSSLLSFGLISPHHFSAGLQRGDVSFLTYRLEKNKLAKRTMLEHFIILPWQNCRAWTPPHSVLSGLYALSYWFNPQKSDWQTSPSGDRGSGTGMFLPSISSSTSFSAHRQHIRKNKQQIRYQQ